MKFQMLICFIIWLDWVLRKPAAPQCQVPNWYKVATSTIALHFLQMTPTRNAASILATANNYATSPANAYATPTLQCFLAPQNLTPLCSPYSRCPVLTQYPILQKDLVSFCNSHHDKKWVKISANNWSLANPNFNSQVLHESNPRQISPKVTFRHAFLKNIVHSNFVQPPKIFSSFWDPHQRQFFIETTWESLCKWHAFKFSARTFFFWIPNHLKIHFISHRIKNIISKTKQNKKYSKLTKNLSSHSIRYASGGDFPGRR